MTRLALLDRDGTIIVEKRFLSDRERVELIPGAAEAIRRLNAAGWAVAIVTNQSGVGRGFYRLSDMHAVNARVVERLAGEGARVDVVEYCPHHPAGGIPWLRRRCNCRKPAPGQAIRAARRLGVSLTGCAAVGDRLSDVELGLRLGGRGILVLTGDGAAHRLRLARARITPSAVVPSLSEAVDRLLAG
jgi:D-glycero-D-manno-heptose 1,7-bisphosphate phosphatase